MSDYEQLRRGQYHPDAASKAAQQEAAELGRGSYHPDALAKAREQEEFERREDEARARAAGSRKASKPSSGTQRREKARDINDRTVVRRTAARREDSPSGGAVMSKRSGLGMAVRRRLRQSNSEGRARKREAERERRRWEREQRRRERGGHGLRNFLLVLAGILVALYLVICLPIDRSIAFSRSESRGLSKELSWHVPGMPYYVLALGSDAREGETVSRSDTMILVRVDPIGGKVTMLSIPRDTMVEIEGHGTQKINAAYAFDGVAGAVHEVHELTGAPISQVAVVRFDGVESLVDYLGGVTVDVPVPVYDPEYTGLILDAGRQEMDGHTALLFSRVRHGFELGDYQRQKDQRILIEAIMDKTLGMAPWEMPGVVRNMGDMLGTSMRMYSILPLMARLKIGGATIYQATVPSTTAMVDGISYVIADQEGLAQMMEVIDNGGDPAALM